MDFSWVDRTYEFWRGWPRKEVKCHFHDIMLRIHNSSSWFIAIDISLNHLTEVVFVGYSLVQLLFVPLSVLYSGRGSLCMVYDWVMGSYALSPWGGTIHTDYLESYMVVFLFSLNNLLTIILLWTYGYLFYTFILYI